MKRSLVLVLLLAALVACGAPEHQLVGRWQSEEGGYVNQLDLLADGTYSGTLQRRTAMGSVESVGHYSGRWKLRGEKFTGQVMDSDVSLIAAGYTWADDVVEYDQKSMVLRSPSAHEVTWQRLNLTGD